MQKFISKISHQTTGRWSAFLALACAVHCVAMPFISAALPLIGLQFLESPVFEVGLILAGLSFGAFSVVKGYRQQHRSIAIPLIFLAGSLMLLSGVLFFPEPWEIVMVVSGAIAVAAAQLMNLRLAPHTHNAACTH